MKVITLVLGLALFAPKIHASEFTDLQDILPKTNISGNVFENAGVAHELYQVLVDLKYTLEAHQVSEIEGHHIGFWLTMLNVLAHGKSISNTLIPGMKNLSETLCHFIKKADGKRSILISLIVSHYSRD